MTTAPFDIHAASYDLVAETELGRVLRARVHAVLNDLIAPGDAVLDVGCGTGIDSAWLAPQVRTVHAIDASAEMVARASARCVHQANVTVTRADAAALTADRPVDLVLANFGVVNCVGDLRNFGHRVHDALRPGGYAVLVTMARYCPVELAVAAATANRDLLQRRRTSTQPHAAGYGDIQIRYASANDLQSAFGDKLALTSAQSLGLVLPPFEQRSWVEDRPRLRNMLAVIDERLGRAGALTGLGDHHIAVFRRPA